MGGLPADGATPTSAQQFGINKGRVLRQPAGRDRLRRAEHAPAAVRQRRTLRKAANYAIDRPAMLRVRGAFAGKRTDQILPPGMGGFKRREGLPDRRARTTRRPRRSPATNCEHGEPLDATTTAVGQALGQVFKYNLGADRLRREREALPGLPDLRRRRPEGRRLRRRDRRLEPGLPGSVRLHRRPAERQQHPRRRTTTTSRTSTSRAINKQLARRQQAHPATPATRRTASSTCRSRRSYAPWAAYDNRNEREFVSSQTGGYLFQPANASADLNTFFVK